MELRAAVFNLHNALKRIFRYFKWDHDHVYLFTIQSCVHGDIETLNIVESLTILTPTLVGAMKLFRTIPIRFFF